MRAAEVSTVARLKQCFEDLNCVGRLGLEEAGDPSNVLGARRGSMREQGWRGAALAEVGVLFYLDVQSSRGRIITRGSRSVRPLASRIIYGTRVNAK